jgi:hypothetical protein
MIASVTCEVLANHLAGDTAIPGRCRPGDGERYDDFRRAAQSGGLPAIASGRARHFGLRFERFQWVVAPFANVQQHTCNMVISEDQDRLAFMG